MMLLWLVMTQQNGLLWKSQKSVTFNGLFNFVVFESCDQGVLYAHIMLFILILFWKFWNSFECPNSNKNNTSTTVSLHSRSWKDGPQKTDTTATIATGSATPCSHYFCTNYSDYCSFINWCTPHLATKLASFFQGWSQQFSHQQSPQYSPNCAKSNDLISNLTF